MNRASGTLVVLTLVFAAVAMAHPLAEDDHMENLGAFTPLFFAELQDVELLGDRAHVFGVGGLAVLDISQPGAPLLLGRYEPPGHPFNRFYRGAVEGTLALGGGREDGLSVMFLPTLGDPQLLTVHGPPGSSYEGVVLRDGIGYACRHGDGVEILDLQQPATPTILSTVTSLSNAWDAALVGDHLYVADGAGGLAVIDVTDPAQPVHLTSLATSGAAQDVATDGSLLVVTCGSAGFDVFTLGDPASPAWTGNANTSGLAITAAVSQGKAYIADWDDVEVFDLMDPSAPEPVGWENTPVRAMGLAANDDLVVVADWSQLRLYRSGPSLAGDIEVPVDGIDFGDVPVGAQRDTVIDIGNTGGAPILVDEVRFFSDSFTLLTPSSFTIPAGGSFPLGIRFHKDQPGYTGTFMRISSDDGDEGTITLPVTADDNPNQLDLGEEAPNWLLQDTGGVVHHLMEQEGRIVVMAFFANW